MSTVPSTTTRQRGLGATCRRLALALAAASLALPAAAHGEVWTGQSEGAERWASAEAWDDANRDESTVELQYPDAIGVAEPLADPWTHDSQVVEAQASRAPALTAPRRRTVTATARRTGTAAIVGLASVPYMIGDTGAGSCIGFSGIVNAELSHPTLACARLNIAEANSAAPVDRLYYSYRHFHNASTVSAYQFNRTLDYDRHLIAWERTFWGGGASVELRLPIERHVTSTVFTTIVPSLGIVEVLDSTQPERTTELGNVAGIFKYSLWENETLLISGGLGVTVPTARDVDYFLNIDAPVVFPNAPGLTADVAAIATARFANETVYLEPFLAWLVHPEGRWYHQGFLQVETAANPSRMTFFSAGAASFQQNGVPIGTVVYEALLPQRLELFSQTLMRLNLSVGRIMVDRPRARGLNQLSAQVEMHYTTTLQDANLTTVPLTDLVTGGAPTFQAITVGNADNRVDILNAAAGFSAQFGQWLLTNGIVAPVRDCSDCGFDLEYNAQVQRRF